MRWSADLPNPNFGPLELPAAALPVRILSIGQFGRNLEGLGR